MSRFLKERIKSWLLVGLVAVSFVQIGILWNYQSHGLPFNFISAFFTGGSQAGGTDTVEKSDVFSPYRLMFSSGNGAYYILGEDDPNYGVIWEDARYSIKEALSRRPDEIMAGENWDSLIEKRAYIIQFKAVINTSLVSWFLDVRATAQEFPGTINKILVRPGDGSYNNVNTVYLFDGSRIYRYVVRAQAEGFNTQFCTEFMKTVNADAGNNYKVYNMFGAFNPENRMRVDISPEVLIVNSSPYVRKYPDVEVSLPGRLDDIGTAPTALLGRERNSYIVSNNEAYILINNLENIYRIYKNGVLEYRYTQGSASADKGEANEAMAMALEFIGRGKNLIGDSEAELFLSGCEETGTAYRFTFNYRVGSLPVYLSVKTGDYGGTVSDAIVIEANKRRVLSCRWLLTAFESGRVEREYDARFESITSGVDRESFVGSETVEMCAAYAVKEVTDKPGSVMPSWVVEKADGSFLDLRLPEAEGE